MAAPFLRRISPIIAFLFPLACGGRTAFILSVDGGGSGTGSGGSWGTATGTSSVSGAGSATGTGSGTAGRCSTPDPGCCQEAPDGCYRLFPTGVCSGGTWTCPGTDFPPGDCDALCVGIGSGTGTGTGGCQGPNPGCCGFIDNEGCNTIVGPATCVGETWSCGDEASIGPVCKPGCRTGSDAGATNFPCGTKGLTCDWSDDFCSMWQGPGIRIDGGIPPACAPIPAECLADVSGSLAQCFCVEGSTPAQGSCSLMDAGGFTITFPVR
jgi:hypothetical protein